MHKSLVIIFAVVGLSGTAFASEDSDDAASAFLGHWTFQSGSKVTSPCSSDVIDQTGKTFDVTAGAAAGEILTKVQDCPLTYIQTDATHAKLKESTACTLSGGSSPINVTFTSATMVLNGTTLTTELTGRSGLCTVTLKGTALK
ncbi:hypothetical protein LVJ94_52610 [Pendulispora rubella]|uniref:Lipocalin-like domain-containing protein n=1 Tax=Pendulispora rubella TaxID=2741070 RepID=A0ABZ2L3J6_9BACT